MKIETDPSNISLHIGLPNPKKTWKSKGQTTYYVDSTNGEDTAGGDSPAHAWRTLDKVNSGEFTAGDKILLRAGSRWEGFLALNSAGSAEAPIVVDSYGEGAKPRIEAEEKYTATVLLANCEYIELNNLELTNKGPVHQPGLYGLRVNQSDFGVAHHIVFRSLYIHDVTACLTKGGGGGAIVFLNAGRKVMTRFEDILIEKCHLQHIDRDGITMFGNGGTRDRWFPSLKVVIRENLLEDIGGDGIVPSSCDGALVERNILHGGRMRAPDSAAGIWPGSCDNTILQFNEVSGMKGTRDGEGYDSDWNCRGTVVQYNFSHDNDGGFMLICDDGDIKPPKNIGNIGTIVRYNISVNDGLHSFNITGPCERTQIYNNVIFIGRKRPLSGVNGNASSATQAIVNSGNWGGAFPHDTLFANNIFYVSDNASASFNLSGMRDLRFDTNCYWGEINDRPGDVHAITADPRLHKPGSLNATDYKPNAGSPCLGTGISICKQSLKDYAADTIPAGSRPSIGVFQNP